MTDSEFIEKHAEYLLKNAMGRLSHLHASAALCGGHKDIYFKRAIKQNEEIVEFLKPKVSPDVIKFLTEEEK